MKDNPASRSVPPLLPLNQDASLIQRHLGQAALLVTAGCAITVAGLGIWICFSGSPNVRGLEINVVLTIQKVLLGRPLYTDPGDIPFDIAQYGPLYYAICVGLASLLGFSFDDPARITIVCRVVSFLCACLTFAGCFFFTKHVLLLRTSLGIVCTAFAFAATSPWFFVARPDALMCFTMLASFAFAIASASRHSVISYVYLLMAVCLGCASAFAKQSGVQAIIIVPLYFLFIRQFWKCVASLAATLMLGGITCAILAYKYPQLMPNVVSGVNNGIDLHWAFINTYIPFFSNFAFLLGLTLLSVTKWARPRTDDRHAFFVVSLPVLFVFAVVTGMKWGSDSNYFNEFLVVAAVAAGCFVQSSESVGVAPPVIRNQGMLVVVIAAYLVCFMPYWTLCQVGRSWWLRLDPRVSLVVPRSSLWSEEYHFVGQQLRADLESDPEALVLSFDSGISSVIPERSVVPQKEIAKIMCDRRVVDYTLFRQYLAEGRIKYVVIHRSTSVPEKFLDASLSGHYSLDRYIGAFAVYKWRD